MWMARRKKGRLSFRRAGRAALRLLPGPPVCVSITLTIERAPICTQDVEPGSYDREVFLVLKEFEPTFSQGGDMAQDFLAPTTRVKALETAGESAMKASLAKGMPRGYEVSYRYFTINGRMLGHASKYG